ncbi:hypothetical protein AYI68_g572 [Smittium mucronatum]|uniref:Uncharacterized protein n=1 Tax=Smittium mucronatum TaxID=133383 RepID=A0A1R0H7W1_9FUNG|nr:hypothetical protein AYI68_g572 [Smittium mucronatum]
MESNYQAPEYIETFKLTMFSDFKSFLQNIKISIKLIAGENNTIAISILRKKIDPEIRKYVPKIANESLEAQKQRLYARMQGSQVIFSSNPKKSNGMDVESYSTVIQAFND